MTSSTTITAPAPADAPAPKAKAARPPAKRLRNIDQTEFARMIITAWLETEPEAQDAWLARLIAATLHDGSGTALERFAATGQLNAEQSLQELNEVRVPIEREAWVDALGRYVLFTAGAKS